MFELSLGHPIEPVNDFLLRHNIVFQADGFHASRAVNDIFENELMADVERLALGCFQSDQGLVPSDGCPTFVTPETERYLDLLRAGRPSRSFLAGAAAFATDALKQLRRFEARSPDVSAKTIPPYTGYGFRLGDDPDSVQRFGPTSFYLAGGATVSGADANDYQFVSFVSDIKSTICFGPHVDLPAGTYSFTFDLSAQRKRCYEGTANIFVAVKAERGNVVVLEEQAFTVDGRSAVKVTFRLESAMSTVEPQLHSAGSVVRVYGSMLEAD